jgi:hypothetical protein
MLSRQSIIEHTKESILKNYGPEFLFKANHVCELIGNDLLCIMLICSTAIDKPSHLDNVNVCDEANDILRELVDMYKKKLVSEYRIISELAPGHCGQIVDGKIQYNTKKYYNQCGNTEKRTLRQIKLICEYLGIDYEIRIAISMGNDLLPNYIHPVFDFRMNGYNERLYIKFTFVISDVYRDRLYEAGYPIDEFIKAHNECGYTAFWGCEKYEFPELFKEKGSKFVMSKEDIIELLDIVKASKIPFLEIDFIDVKKGIAKLVVNDVSLNTYKKDGLNLTIPHCHKVNLEPDFFEGDHEEYEEDGEKRYRFTIPINAK